MARHHVSFHQEVRRAEWRGHILLTRWGEQGSARVQVDSWKKDSGYVACLQDQIFLGDSMESHREYVKASVNMGRTGLAR